MDYSPVQERWDALVDQALRLLGPGEAAVNWVAARQHSVIARVQAQRCGLGRTARQNRCRRGSWQTLSPRVYLVGTQPPSDAGRVLAAVMDAGSHAIAGAHSAAFLDGLRDRLPATIDVAMVGRHNAAPRLGVRIRRPRALGWEHVRFRQGVPLTCPVETLLGLAEDLDTDELEAITALALRRRLVSAEALAEVRGRPGAAELRRAAAAPLLTRSGNERRMLALVRRAELPEPEANVRVGGKELDLYWPAARLGVEVDVFSTHGSPASFEDDRAVDADLGRQVSRCSASRVGASVPIPRR